MKKEKISILIVSRVFYLFPVKNKQKKVTKRKIDFVLFICNKRKNGIFFLQLHHIIDEERETEQKKNENTKRMIISVHC